MSGASRGCAIRVLRSRRGCRIAGTVGQIIRRSVHPWPVRVYNGRDTETKKRMYLHQTVHGGLRGAQSNLNKMLSDRDRSRNLDLSRQTLNQYWMAGWRFAPGRTCARRDLLTTKGSWRRRRYVRPALGAKAFHIQTLYVQLLSLHIRWDMEMTFMCSILRKEYGDWRGRSCPCSADAWNVVRPSHR